MKTRYNILYISVLFLTGMTACAKEDTLTPEVDTNIDCFAPAADAMDEESVLRRTFFEQENCYLLFSDTLRREELGKDSNGDMQYFIELLDVNYSVGASTNSSLTYSYKLLQSMEEKKQATSFLQEYVLPHLSASIRPFSWFLSTDIQYPDAMMGGSMTSTLTVSGERAVALAVGDILTLSEEGKNALAESFFISYLGGTVMDNEAALEEFYTSCGNMHEGKFSIADNPQKDMTLNLHHCKEAGFLVAGVLKIGSYVIQQLGKYPDKTDDINAYVELIFSSTMEQIKVDYAEYPKIIERAQLLSDLVIELGYIY